MRRFLLLFAALAAGITADAMPLGLRTAAWGIASACREAGPTQSVVVVSFNANGGSVSPSSRRVTKGSAVGRLPTATRNGYDFLGWFTAASGGSQVYASTTVSGNVTYYAHWQANGGSGGGGGGTTPPEVTFTVSFNANGGSVSTSTRTVKSGAAVGSLPTATRNGYDFLGWFTAASGGSQVYASTTVSGDVTYYAHWQKVVAPEPEEVYELCESVVGPAPTLAASEYNGYLVDAKGNVKGTIQVKVGKPGKKDGMASVKATVVVGAKKVTLSATERGKAEIKADGPTTVALVGKGAEACEITIGAEGLSGSYGAYVIDGARNFFSSKDKAEQIEANKLADGLIGSYNLVWSGGVASVTIGKKGKAKMAATLEGGKKVTANAALLIGEEWFCVPVSAPKANLSLVVWLPAVAGHAPYVAGLGDDAVIGRPGKLAAGAKFRMDAAAFEAVLGQSALPYLPDGVSVGLSGTKWVVANGAKAGKLTMKNGVLDASKAGENPAGLKLTYSAKDGSFKGSFKAYAVVGGKLKATTVNVSGVMIGSKGYGSASIKKLGSCPVTIE